MKILLISAVLFAGYFFSSYKESLLVIGYYYDGPHQIDIKRGLAYWHTNNFEFKQVLNIEDAYLIVSHTNPSQIADSKWVAQYNNRNKTIYVNNKYDKVLRGDNLSGVIAHEAGHFLGLEHNNETKSVMNNKMPYDTTPSFLDKTRARNQIRILYYKKIIDDNIFSK